ncbi:MAG: UDP-N-acetylmuramate dehydrogenase [Gemmatimonadota bacterium]|nr:UDP-N-acetylmuramate dehydrogenase [Gemmatimonadota bacterium]MDH3366408.1 UDP-N-acetylmuramate dehydrogenase [Gemmatimonadota bacterium]MDH3478952.1 UDP-N-acetylmuramate dehydrogenase [Gemmatimonadota bacterium]
MESPEGRRAKRLRTAERGIRLHPNAQRELASRIAGQLRFDEPLAAYTTYRIGGPASAIVFPSCENDVVESVRFAARNGYRWFALGLGSNILVSDAGFDGLVIRFGKGLDPLETEVNGDQARWRAGAGLPTPLLARRSAKAGLAGVHRLVGVPGTVGGGVFMNAGAHGQDFGSVVTEVELIGGDGRQRVVTGSEVPWRYRGSGLEGSLVLSATLQLDPADPIELEKEVQQHFGWRKAGTPFNEPCCGSVFRNPPAESLPADGPRTAGQLIDSLGLKGFRVGGAEVSRKHANYVVNVGAATASDVLSVISAVRERVHQEYGLELVLEVQVVGG